MCHTPTIGSPAYPSIQIYMHGTSSYLRMIHTLSKVCVPSVGAKDLCHSSMLEAKMNIGGLLYLEDHDIRSLYF